MEEINLTPQADLFYKKALSKNPNNPIAKQMYAAFLEGQ